MVHVKPRHFKSCLLVLSLFVLPCFLLGKPLLAQTLEESNTIMTDATPAQVAPGESFTTTIMFRIPEDDSGPGDPVIPVINSYQVAIGYDPDILEILDPSIGGDIQDLFGATGGFFSCEDQPAGIPGVMTCLDIDLDGVGTDQDDLLTVMTITFHVKAAASSSEYKILKDPLDDNEQLIMKSPEVYDSAADRKWIEAESAIVYTGTVLIDSGETCTDIDNDQHADPQTSVDCTSMPVDDCDDSNADVNPDMTEIVHDDLDNDCNPATLDNNSPVATSITASNDTPLVGEEVTFTCNAGDPDGDTLTYLWNLGHGFEPPPTTTNQVTHAYDTVGPVTASCAAEDAYGGISEPMDVGITVLPGVVDDDGDGFSPPEDCDDTNPDINPDADEILHDDLDNDCNPATLDNNPPFATSITASDTHPTEGDAVTFTCNASDPDSDSLTYHWELEPPVTTPDTATQQVTHTYATAGQYTATCSVDDGYQGTAGPVSILITVGAAPIDDDGDGWSPPADCDDNNANINPGMTEILHDDIDNDCDEATPDNNPPFVISITASDTHPTEGDTVTFTCNASDPDTDPLTYHWQLEPLVTTPDTATPQTTHTYATAGQYTASCSVDDGYGGYAGPVSVFVTVGQAVVDEDGDGWSPPADCDDNNASINPGMTEVLHDGLDNDCNAGTLDNNAPFVMRITVSNANPTTGEQVIFSCHATDQDGDTLTYSWDLQPNVNTPDTATYQTTHTYNTAGQYIARCSVADGYGGHAGPVTTIVTVGEAVIDDDGDGWSPPADCDDSNPDINPDQTEIRDDGLDNDCDPTTPDSISINPSLEPTGGTPVQVGSSIGCRLKTQQPPAAVILFYLALAAYFSWRRRVGMRSALRVNSSGARIDA